MQLILSVLVLTGIPVGLAFFILGFPLSWLHLLPRKTIDQKDMPNGAWWKISRLRSKGKSVELVLERLMVPLHLRQTVICRLSQLTKYELYIFRPLREGRWVHVRFESRIRETGEVVCHIDHEAEEDGPVTSVNVIYLRDLLNARGGIAVGPAKRI